MRSKLGSIACWCLVIALGAACSSGKKSQDRGGSGSSGAAAVGAAGSAGVQAGSGGAIDPQAGSGANIPLLDAAVVTPMDACASAELMVTRVVPTVWLLVDGSGSMSAGLDGSLNPPSRWTVLRDVLMTDGTGLVPRLQSSVAFGLYVYDGGTSLPGMAGPQCPRTEISVPALNNAAAMATVYPAAQTGASTPTHYALIDLKKRIDAAGPNPNGPTYIVLATDGGPNLCDFHDGIGPTPATEQEAVDTTMQLSAAGTNVFVISLAGNDPELATHLQAVAAAGGTGTQPFTPTTQDDLAKALTQIIGATASCDLRIKGRVEVGRECTGTVTLNGTPLVCNDPNGYRLKEDRQSLELTGDACSMLQMASSPTLKATFPCADVVVL